MTQEQISRVTRDLCQVCWQDAHPSEYCPDLNRYGPCAECGAEALVTRSRIVECGAIYTTNTLGGMDVCARPAGHPGGHNWRR
jgi:hypothetical protein